MAAGDLITLTYAKLIARVTGSASDTLLAALITAASDYARQFCRRDLSPRQYDELYDGSGRGFLVLRNAPLIALDTVTCGPSTSNPQSFAGDSFDMTPGQALISFKPTETADYFYGYSVSLQFPVGVAAVRAQYAAGFGYRTSVAAAISAGNQTVTPAAMSGYTNGPWSINSGDTLVIDSGLATEETVTVTATSSTTFTATFAKAHAAGAYVLGTVLPADLQFAVAQIVANMYRRPDSTLQSETLGKHSWELRRKMDDVVLTPEVRATLARYRDVMR